MMAVNKPKVKKPDILAKYTEVLLLRISKNKSLLDLLESLTKSTDNELIFTIKKLFLDIKAVAKPMIYIDIAKRTYFFIYSKLSSY